MARKQGKIHAFVFLMGVLVQPLCAQDLAPRAYVITPKDGNAVTLTWEYFNGGLNFNGTVPIKDAQGVYNIEAVSVYHSFNFFGRSANVLAALPYAVGNFTGEVGSQNRSVYRSGLADFSARISVNLYGGKAMDVVAHPKSYPNGCPGWRFPLSRIEALRGNAVTSFASRTLFAGDRFWDR